MRYVTSGRLKALGILLVEAAGLALLLTERLAGDGELRGALARLWSRARSL